MKDQCVCITGSTHGIGFGIAEAFAKKGAKIVINSHEKDNGALDKLKKLTECYFVQSDLSTIDGNKKLIEEASTKLGKIESEYLNLLISASIGRNLMGDYFYHKTLSINDEFIDAALKKFNSWEI